MCLTNFRPALANYTFLQLHIHAGFGPINCRDEWLKLRDKILSMCKTLLIIALALCPFLTRAQQSPSDFERGLSVMEKQGQIRREGNKIIFLNMRPGDTAFSREMYNKMLEKTDKSKNPYTIAFEIAP